MDLPLKIVLSLGGLLISLVIHEQMHARVAYWLGDPTGKNENRFSWNPVHHLDPFQSLILPVLLFIGSKGRFTFGGAKPCPINPMNFRNPSLGMCLSAAAGPLSNYALAAAALGVLAVLHRAFPSALSGDGSLTPNGYFLVEFVLMNLFLGSFNLLPIPPLDGSRLLRHFAPAEVQRVLDAIEPFGMVFVLALVFLGASQVIAPVRDLGFGAIQQATGPAFFEVVAIAYKLSPQ